MLHTGKVIDFCRKRISTKISKVKMVKKRQHEGQSLRLIALAMAGMLVWASTCIDAVADYDRAKYTESAHGSSTAGVKRTPGESSSDYARGNCAHCHEQHAIIDGYSHTPYEFALFAPNNPTSQTDNFCFQCHCSVVASKQSGMVENKDYGGTFGGGTAIFYHIKDAFNPGAGGSSHDLAAVAQYAKTHFGSLWMTDDTNACLVCHDAHYSQKSFPVQINARGGVDTSIRRGIDVVDYPRNLWGDDPLAIGGFSEMMSDWSTEYQAPFYEGGSLSNPKYEPAGDNTSDGSNLPNYVSVCAQTCHRNSVSSLLPINWKTVKSSTWPGMPDKHGRLLGNGSDYGNLKPPFTQAESYNYVLSCMDCHEPHGSVNEWLLRTTVNGVSGLSVADGKWYYWCQACHEVGAPYMVHGDPSEMEETDCRFCHRHGSWF
jgi:hypothetical protein